MCLGYHANLVGHINCMLVGKLAIEHLVCAEIDSACAELGFLRSIDEAGADKCK